MKKILIAIPCLLTGGTEIQTLNLVHALIESKYSVGVACYFEYSGEMIERFKNAGAEVFLFNNKNIPRPSGFKAFQFLYSSFKKILKNFHPDLIHLQYMAPGAIPIIALRALGFKNIIATSHTSGDIYGGNLWLPRLIAKRFVKLFTCVSEAAEKSFFRSSHLFNSQSKIPHNRHLTIHNCLPPSFKNPAFKKVKGSVVFSIGAVSRLDYIKGIDILLKAFAIVKKQTKIALELHIAGDGQEKDNLAELAKKLGIEEQIHWHGLVHHNDLPEFYSSCNVIVVPSRSEGFGLTAIEAMAHGSPVVASSTGGLPEIIQDGETGLLFEKENPESLALALQYCIDNPTILNEMQDRSLTSSERFFFQQYKENIRQLYKEIENTP